LANFDDAFAVVLGNEGGYKPAEGTDPGGETYAGIARNKWPNWEGWSIIDQSKGGSGFPENLKTNAPLNERVKDFYRDSFWQFSVIKDQSVATKLFDMCVNMGKKESVLLLQTILVHDYGHKELELDGVWGPMTEKLVNLPSPWTLEKMLRRDSAIRYAEIGIKRPAEWNENKRGWMMRAVS
jgi:lysozyme family protein